MAPSGCSSATLHNIWRAALGSGAPLARCMLPSAAPGFGGVRRHQQRKGREEDKETWKEKVPWLDPVPVQSMPLVWR